MQRQPLLKDLQLFQPRDKAEEESKAEIIEFVERAPDCFDRVHHAGGHVTGSGILVDREGQRVLLNHHKIFDIWMQFGGHADGEADIENVAYREIIEESGITAIERLGNGIMDVDVHIVSANDKKGEPEHKHYDVRYLFRVTDDSDFVLSDESYALRWCSYDEACSLTDGATMRRMLDKWKEICK